MTATPEALSMATVAARAASAKLGENISVIDVSDQLVITDYFVIASASKINADEAFLAGLLHGIGELYVLARMSERADLLSNSEEVRALLGGWHAAIGKSLLENWIFPAHIVEAVEGPIALTSCVEHGRHDFGLRPVRIPTGFWPRGRPVHPQR